MRRNDERGKKQRGRPARSPEDAATRQNLIKVGLSQLTERGYCSTGLADVLTEAGVPKGCFYHYFRNKADFGDALIDAYQNYFSTKLDRCFQDTDLSHLDRLRRFVEEASAGMAKYDFKRGCLVGNLGQEMGALPESFRERLQSIFQDWQARTEACLAKAQAAGEIATHCDPQELAAFFWIGWEGAVLRAKLDRNTTPLSTFAKGFFTILEK